MSTSIWTGIISFGMVEIPINIHSAQESEKQISFRTLDAKTKQPIRQQRVSTSTGKEVVETVRGYEYAEGKYVVVTEEELESVRIESNHTVDIECFVDFGQIDPRLLEKPYYLKAQTAGSKGYALLHQVLTRTGKCGIAQITMRTKTYVAVVRTHGPALTLQLLRYPDEIRTPAQVDIRDTDLDIKQVSAKELDLALSLVKGMVEDWNPAKYTDKQRDATMALIEAKAKKGKLTLVKSARPKPMGEVIDMMALLEKSVTKAARRKVS